MSGLTEESHELLEQSLFLNGNGDTNVNNNEEVLKSAIIKEYGKEEQEEQVEQEEMPSESNTNNDENHAPGVQSEAMGKTLPKFNCPTKSCIRRIQRDLKSLYKDPLDGIFVIPDEDRVNICHALINGPTDTPYEFGFFYFRMEFPNDYPHNPPHVMIYTTGGGRVSFNPNLYANGKVCLSILGTWSGPSWSPVQSIGSTLMSIQSLMNSNPFRNEPGYEHIHIRSEQSMHYNRLIRHETIKHAILGMVVSSSLSSSSSGSTKIREKENLLLETNNKEIKKKGINNNSNNNLLLPDQLAEIVKDSFLEVTEYIKCICDEYSFLDGKKFQDPNFRNRGTFQFKALKLQIDELEAELRGEQQEQKELPNRRRKGV